MKRLASLLPAAGLIAASALAMSALTSTIAIAQACQLDNGGGCLRDGMKCSPPKGGHCQTERVGTRELKCSCNTSTRPNSPRGDRGGMSHPGDQPGQPTEEQEPQEPQENPGGHN